MNSKKSLGFEILEPRRLLSGDPADVSASMNNGQLSVETWDGAPVTVACEAGVVNVNGVPVAGNPACSSVTSIGVTGDEGSNVIDLSGVTPSAFTGLSDGGVTVDGGAGNDTVVGSGFGDLLIGGGGSDAVGGGAGSDTLWGGAGDDYLDGGAGNDLMMGGDGDDFMSDNDGVDYFDGGGGTDIALGDTGEDSVYNTEW